MLSIVLFALVAFLIFDLLIYVYSIFRAKSIIKKYPQLYVIGYKDSILFLGYRSDSKVSPVGLVPIVRAQCFDYDGIPPFGTPTEYELRAVFSFGAAASNFRVHIR